VAHCLYDATESFNRHWPVTGVSQAVRTKAESDKEAITEGHGTVRATRSAGKTNIGVKQGFPRRLTNLVCLLKCQHEPWLGLNTHARGKLLHEMDPCRGCFPRSYSRFDVESITSRDIHLEADHRQDSRA